MAKLRISPAKGDPVATKGRSRARARDGAASLLTGLKPAGKTSGRSSSSAAARGLLSERRAALREEAGGAAVAPIGATSAFFAPHLEIGDLAPYDRLPQGSAARVFVRDADAPVGPVHLKLHLTNLLASHEQVFLPALKDGSLFDDYLGTLRRQQTMIMTGPGGVYTGMTGKTVEMAERSARAPDDFQHDMRNRPRPGELLSEVFIRLGGAAPTRTAFSVAAEHLAELGVELVRDGKVKMPGIPVEALPSLSRAGRGLYTGPQIQQLPLYLEAMREQLRRALETLDQPQALEHLADYLQLSSNTHLFPRGNNSMFMSHVNFALERMGLDPISHGVLDVWAYVLDSRDFRQLFYQAVQLANPGVELPVVH